MRQVVWGVIPVELFASSQKTQAESLLQQNLVSDGMR